MRKGGGRWGLVLEREEDVEERSAAQKSQANKKRNTCLDAYNSQSAPAEDQISIAPSVPALPSLCRASAVHNSPLLGKRPLALAAMAAASIYDFTVKDSKGNDVSLDQYKGKVLLIVNVASQCGLTTSNYTELAELYSKYKDQGLEILAFPCNQFGGQEPGTNEEIQEFACTRFKAEYPVFDKVDVNGKDASPLYKFLKKAKGGGLLGDSIKWNFAKFLVSRDGQVVDRFAPTTSPSKIEKDLKKYL